MITFNLHDCLETQTRRLIVTHIHKIKILPKGSCKLVVVDIGLVRLLETTSTHQRNVNNTYNSLFPRSSPNMVMEKETCKMGFGNGSTINSFTANGTSNKMRNMLSLFLQTSLHLFQQPTSAPFLPLNKNPIMSAHSANLLLYAAQHIMYYLPFPTILEVCIFIRHSGNEEGKILPVINIIESDNHTSKPKYLLY